MPLDRNKQYFRDVDGNGKLTRIMESGASARSEFYRVVREERLKPVSFQVSAQASNSWEGGKRLEEYARKKIEDIEKDTWKQAVKMVTLGKCDYMGRFPEEEYDLHTLKDKEGKIYPVRLDCRKLIESHKISDLEWLREGKDKLMKPYEERKNLRVAAVLSVIHLLLNLTTTLSCLPEWRWLYPAENIRVLWALLVAGIMLVAVVRHLSKTFQPLFGVLMALFTFGYQCAGPRMQGTIGEILRGYAGNLDPGKAMMAFGIMLAIPSLFFCVLYIVHACRAKIPKQDWQGWVSLFDSRAERMHKELCFLSLWYKHMTGKTCSNLLEQEKVLFTCAALADKRRR